MAGTLDLLNPAENHQGVVPPGAPGLPSSEASVGNGDTHM